MATPRKRPEIPNPFDQPGLTADVLRDAMRSGEARRALATKIDAPTRGGTDAFFEKVASLRMLLIPHGWTFSNDDNFCTAISPDGKHAIAIAKGSLGTGDEDGEPETARKMGPATLAVVAANKAQGSFFFAETKSSESPILTWILLWRRTGNLVRLELSLPDTESNGFICGWKARYPLPDIDMNPQPLDGAGDGGPDDDDDDSAYDFDVDRRG